MDTNIFYWLTQPTDDKRRPLDLTVICVLGFLGTIFNIAMFFRKNMLEWDDWTLLLTVFSTLIGLFCFLGIWKMKKLAVIILTGFFIVNQIIALAYGNWSVLGIVVPVVVIAIILYHFKEMD